jgi:hypothetical protein
VPEPAEWQPQFDLTGAHETLNTIFIRQDKCDVFYTIDTLDEGRTFIGRYINETHVAGTMSALRKINNCVYSFNVEIGATANQAYCEKNTVRAFSNKCGLTISNNQACFKY